MKPLLDRVSWAIIGALALALIAVVAGLANAGPLDPTNPPGPTMKTLAEVEPRTPISSLPVTITTPGSYYLTANLTVADSHAITISASDVTIDLNGYTLTGTPSASIGIVTLAPISNVRIHDGTVARFPGGGIRLSQATGAVVEDVSVHETTSNGPAIELGASGHVSRCVVLSDLTGRAIQVGANSVVQDCSVTGGNDGIATGDRSIVRDCNVRGSGVHGILVGVGSRVANCRVVLATTYGVRLLGSATLVENTLEGNGTIGGGCNVFVQGSSSHIEDNHFIGGNCGVEFEALGAIENTVYGNTLANVPLANLFVNPGGNDIGPTDDAATATSPFANIVMP